jgi:hypothetical protein
MRHVEKALEAVKNNMIGENNSLAEFIEIENISDEKGVSPIVKFKIQSDPIGEVGVNGCQATDILVYVKSLFESLDNAFPCDENKHTIDSIRTAIHWQEIRTTERKKRGVEGQNKK